MALNQFNHGLRKVILHDAHDFDGEIAWIFNQAFAR
jgi:hypothetical protein